MTKSDALNLAEHNARYKHGQWFAWEDRRGEWHASGMMTEPLKAVACEVKPNSRIYCIGGGGKNSMVFHRYGCSLVDLFLRNSEAEKSGFRPK